MDSSSEEEIELPVPAHKTRFTDMAPKNFKEALRVADSAFEKEHLDKEVALSIVRKLQAHKDFKEGQGEWQCIVGKNFGCSLVFDSKVMAFFDLKERGRSILVFKSG